MKKIIFRYSAMNAGKSANLIMTYYNYKELGLNSVAVVPNNINRNGVYSRIGVGVEAIQFKDLEKYISENKVDCILVDESQFLSREEVDYLNAINVENDITVICYGLRTTSLGELFEGSKRLLAIADILEELPTLCFCGNKARMNIRAIDGIVDKSKETVKLREEQSVSYISVCRRCFNDLYDTEENVEDIINKFDNTRSCK